MKDQTSLLMVLVIGLFVALGVGFGVGYTVGNSHETVSAMPSNYDPARAVAADALKAQQAQTDICYKLMIQKLETTIACPPAGVHFLNKEGKNCIALSNANGVLHTQCADPEPPAKKL